MKRPLESQPSYFYVKKARLKKKERAIAYLGGKCCICGYNKCPRSLDFHHKNPDEKDFCISKNTNKAWATIVKELDKCVILCRNCHGEVHAGITSL